MPIRNGRGVFFVAIRVRGGKIEEGLSELLKGADFRSEVVLQLLTSEGMTLNGNEEVFLVRLDSQDVAVEVFYGDQKGESGRRKKEKKKETHLGKKSRLGEFSSWVGMIVRGERGAGSSLVRGS